MSKKHYRFYMDETDLGGFPFQHLKSREDDLNCFCYAGVLIAEEDIEFVRHNYKAFCAKWGIDYPLHYNAIHGGRGNFAWLGKDKHLTNRDAEAFVKEYHDFMVEQPYKIFGCVVDKVIFQRDFLLRPFKPPQDIFIEVKRKALQITINKLVKKIKSEISTVGIYFEQVGRLEDKAFKEQIKELANNYHPNFQGPELYINDFQPSWQVASTKDFESTLIGEAIAVKKDNEFTQIADFCSYSVAKSLYDMEYRPFKLLFDNERLGDIIYVDV